MDHRLYTSYLTQILALDLQHRPANDKGAEIERAAVRKALSYLASQPEQLNDPYRVALVLLAKLALKEDISKDTVKLLALAHNEGDHSYWNAEYNTVFYSWGFAGRIETTALVLEALASVKQQGSTTPELETAISRGTLFLLRNKDHYGVWYSTQATVNVLQALIRQLANYAGANASNVAPLRIEVDGQPGPELTLPTDTRQLTPLRSSLTALLSPGDHRIALRGGPKSAVSVYVTAIYYLPWNDPSVTTTTQRAGDSEALRYSVKYDHATATVGEPVQCTVHAERVAFQGYGMMLAEVGLPPGADVDRESIETAMRGAGWDIQSYEIQPDRVVVYLWPRAGGTTFTFSLKPRFAMNAQSAESILYDYYNPDAHASVPPARFQVQ
jgi:hypothetical protein